MTLRFVSALFFAAALLGVAYLGTSSVPTCPSQACESTGFNDTFCSAQYNLLMPPSGGGEKTTYGVPTGLFIPLRVRIDGTMLTFQKDNRTHLRADGRGDTYMCGGGWAACDRQPSAPSYWAANNVTSMSTRAVYCIRGKSPASTSYTYDDGSTQ